MSESLSVERLFLIEDGITRVGLIPHEVDIIELIIDGMLEEEDT